MYYAVDYATIDDDIVSFFLRDVEEAVYTCRREGTWALVSRKACHIITDADYAKHQIKEAKEVETFYAELDPEGWKEAQEMMAKGGVEAMLGHNGPQRPSVRDDGKPVPGQYL